ncbi:UbiA family prenyltransferase [Salinarimonas soli]|uniref:UbiA family prenyltransferase n=1 Tax=Salinarimonas soli TaxID=1638099 RepID=UPI0034D2F42C
MRSRDHAGRALVGDAPVAPRAASRLRSSPAPAGVPLVVDLDGTLVRSDLLIETAFSELGRRPRSLVDMAAALSQGKATLKHRLSEPVDFDPAVLPYDDAVIARIEEARAEGRPVYLASASHQRLVSAVAEHLGLFDGWFASNETVNLAGAAKAAELVDAFGEGGFDYIGNDRADLPVWARARNAIAIRTPAAVARRLSALAPTAEHLPHRRPTPRTWAKMLRVHQYAKNALIFLPLLASHSLTPGALVQALLAVVAFSLCASGVYVLNDLVDLQDDRRHRTKCRRPLACGDIPLVHGILAVPLLLAGAALVAALVSWPFMGVLAGYLAITTAYSFYLKRVLLVDVITLASLYSIRVVAGAVAIGVTPSGWLVGFCLSIFLSLALIKRYVELAARLDANQPAPANRGYRTGDLGAVAALAAAAGFQAVTVFALYVSSDAVQGLYTRPDILWLVCPILTYWIARALMLAQRREMDDDPVVFALRDRQSLVAAVLIAALAVAAI